MTCSVLFENFLTSASGSIYRRLFCLRAMFLNMSPIDCSCTCPSVGVPIMAAQPATSCILPGVPCVDDDGSPVYIEPESVGASCRELADEFGYPTLADPMVCMPDLRFQSVNESDSSAIHQGRSCTGCMLVEDRVPAVPNEVDFVVDGDVDADVVFQGVRDAFGVFDRAVVLWNGGVDIFRRIAFAPVSVLAEYGYVAAAGVQVVAETVLRTRFTKDSPWREFDLVFDRCTFIGTAVAPIRTAKHTGDYGDPIRSTITITRSVFSSLALRDDSAVFCSDTNLVVRNSTFAAVRSVRSGAGSMGGAALCVDGSTAAVANSVFMRNTLSLTDSWAGSDGSFARHGSSLYSLKGGAIYATQADLQLSHCQIIGNRVTASLLSPNSTHSFLSDQMFGKISKMNGMSMCFADEFLATLTRSQPLGLRGGACFVDKSDVLITDTNMMGNSAFTSTCTSLQIDAVLDSSLFSPVSFNLRDLWFLSAPSIAQRVMSWDAALSGALATTTAAHWEGGTIYSSYSKLTIKRSNVSTVGSGSEFAATSGSAILVNHAPFDEDETWGIWDSQFSPYDQSTVYIVSSPPNGCV